MEKLEGIMAKVTRRRYAEEFTREAVQLVRESAHPVAQVARDLGIPEHVWCRWTAQHRQAEAHGTARAAQRARYHEQHERHRQLLGQRLCESFFGTLKGEIVYRGAPS